AAQRADMTRQGRGAEPVDVGGGHGGDGLADQVGCLRPAGAERQGDVVLVDAGGFRELLCCDACDGERIHVLAVEGMLGVHPLTVFGEPRERAPAASLARMRDNGGMPYEFERTQRIAVLGGGPGGYEAALTGAQVGSEVTLVERAGRGGAAVRTDAVPSKSLIATAGAATDVRQAA